MLSIGTRLGSYEILAVLGVGGMGEVYRARDGKLHRDVAIKVLPAAVAHDPDRLARFEREAQILASLNHSNIGHIYGLEDAPAVTGQGDVRALVMELVEGPTLADRLIGGPIPLTEALPIARQIAEALEAAHERGILHRDLKPANVTVRDDGTVKVLDFGLAKMIEPHGTSESLSNSPTLVASMPGTILGTAAYMSPEQTKGRVADASSDVWAFGCVLFEMLAGRAAFAGETLAEILSSVLKGHPDWTRLPDDTPHGVRALLTRCLQKSGSSGCSTSATRACCSRTRCMRRSRERQTPSAPRAAAPSSWRRSEPWHWSLPERVSRVWVDRSRRRFGSFASTSARRQRPIWPPSRSPPMPGFWPTSSRPAPGRSCGFAI